MALNSVPIGTNFFVIRLFYKTHLTHKSIFKCLPALLQHSNDANPSQDLPYVNSSRHDCRIFRGNSFW